MIWGEEMIIDNNAINVIEKMLKDGVISELPTVKASGLLLSI